MDKALPRNHPSTWDSDTPCWQDRPGHPIKGNQEVDFENQPDFFGWCPTARPRLEYDTLRLLCRRVISGLGSPDWTSLKPKHGPGAVSERGWVSKYEFPIWPRKLDLWFPFEWYGSGEVSPETWPSDKEPFSKLIAVPKTRKGPRLICAEPIAHQWMQQSIFGWLRKSLRKSLLGLSIDFEDQEASRKLALQASRDGSYATLDLSEASDRLSGRLVEYVFQGNRDLLDSMHACRTRAVKQTLVGGLQEVTLLRKFATMGSALTFPVQSIVFTLLSVWALRLAEGRERDWRGLKADFERVRVFGDDIIVPTHAYDVTKLVLHECGLLVNARKSFGGISFRESCGMDAFRGVDVAPARYRTPYSGSADSTAALIEFSNNLFTKGFWRTSDVVLRAIPPRVRKHIVVHGPEDGSLGLCSFVGNDFHLRPRRWDRHLQREYIRRLGFFSKVRRVQGRGRSSLTQFFTEDPASRRDFLTEVVEWRSGRATTGSLVMRPSRVYL